MGAEKEAVRRRYLRAHAGQFALVMFSRNSCGYSRVQWPRLDRFRQDTGWQVPQLAPERRHELRLRSGVHLTTTTTVIRRNCTRTLVHAAAAYTSHTLAHTHPPDH